MKVGSQLILILTSTYEIIILHFTHRHKNNTKATFLFFLRMKQCIGVDNFGYSPIQRAVTVLLYRTNS
jgi:hypothetical protein